VVDYILTCCCCCWCRRGQHWQ